LLHCSSEISSLSPQVDEFTKLTNATTWSQRFAMTQSRILIVTKSQEVSQAWVQCLREASNGIVQGIPKKKVAYSSLHKDFDLIIIDAHQCPCHPNEQKDVPEEGFSDTILLCHQIHKQFDNPIILLTARRDEEYVLRAYQAGVSECIVEPIILPLLIAKIMAWLRWSRPHHPNSTLTSIDKIGVAAIASTQLTI
jgi:CheY-like chemotaxis protein